jgi:hypothetical protein
LGGRGASEPKRRGGGDSGEAEAEGAVAGAVAVAGEIGSGRDAGGGMLRIIIISPPAHPHHTAAQPPAVRTPILPVRVER